jgi:Holliday junction resolvase RusA-like endonuclease
MARINKEIYEGTVKWDIYAWDDCDRGLYVDDDKVESIISKFNKKKIRITIEEIPDTED